MLSNCYRETKMLCPLCRVAHPAVAVEENGEAFWEIDCPRGRRRVRMSTDAALFGRARAGYPVLPEATVRRYSNLILHINDDCSLQCPVCFASAEATGWRIGLADLRRRAERIRQYRPVVVMLSGGEPTEHPQIEEIVRILAREYRFKVSMLTNGVRLGRDAAFAARLHAAGLRKASISFDTFQPEVSRCIRGGGQELIDVKLQALRNCWAVRLNTGIVTTLCQENLAELPELLRFAIDHADHLSVFDIQCLQEGGRLPPGLSSVDRERAIRTMTDSGVVPGMTPDDFMTPPAVPSYGFAIHPDCGSGLFLLVRDGRVRLLDRVVNFRALAAALARPGFLARHWRKLDLAVKVIRYIGFSGFALRQAWLWGRRREREAVLLVAITTLMKPDKLDCERIRRCPNGILAADGTIYPCCFYYNWLYKPERKREL